MTFTGSSIISCCVSLCGSGFGLVFAWSLIQKLAAEGFILFAVSIPHILLWIGIAVIAGVIAAILPAIRAAKQNILEAISYE